MSTSSQPTSNSVILQEFDPWKSASVTPDPHPELHTPDPSTLDETVTQGFKSAEKGKGTAKPDVPSEVLNEFDPLANQVERDARDAWQSAESHPPPPPPPPKPMSRPQTPVLPNIFPALSSLARSLNIAASPKQRPVSLDAPAHVPSPSILSAFATQAEAPPEAPPTPQTPSAPPTFDFQTFLDQMKSKSAEPIARYLKSFLGNFAKRTFTVNDQIKIINDFLGFIAGKMRECDIWRNASDLEFDHAMEGIEKLVMNRLYEFTFTPQVARSIPPRPVTSDDLERDRVLSQRIALFGWVEEKHLDIPVGEGSKGFLMFAQQELLKINHYKAPRDKLICVLNCCKVIFGLIRHLKKDESADSFVPILIFVVLKANPDHLLSNIEFINRFRNPEKLKSEAGYYLSSLMGAVSFVETMDHTSLSNITKEEFEKYVEQAIQALPRSAPPSPSQSYSEPSTPRLQYSQHTGEESALPLSLPTPSQTLSEDALRLLQKTGDTISKPLNAIGRIFSDAIDNAEGKLSYLPGPFAPLELGREARENAHDGRGTPPPVPHWAHPDQVRQFDQQRPQTPTNSGGPVPIQPPYKPRVRRGGVPSRTASPAPGFDTPSRPGPYTNQPFVMGPSQALMQPSAVSRTPTPNLDFAGMQAEIDYAHEQAAAASRATLVQMFPDVDKEVIGWVLEANEGDLGRSIEAMLEVSSGS